MRRSPADGRTACQSNGAGKTCGVDAKTLEKKRCDGTSDAGEIGTQTSHCIQRGGSAQGGYCTICAGLAGGCRPTPAPFNQVYHDSQLHMATPIAQLTVHFHFSVPLSEAYAQMIIIHRATAISGGTHTSGCHSASRRPYLVPTCLSYHNERDNERDPISPNMKVIVYNSRGLNKHRSVVYGDVLQSPPSQRSPPQPRSTTRCVLANTMLDRVTSNRMHLLAAIIIHFYILRRPQRLYSWKFSLSYNITSQVPPGSIRVLVSVDMEASVSSF